MYANNHREPPPMTPNLPDGSEDISLASSLLRPYQTAVMDSISEPEPQKPSGPLAGLDARNISAWFGQRKVLDRVSLNMEPGTVTALIVPSGCGKSTFLRILNRMHEMVPGAKMAGEVRLNDEDIYDAGRRLTDVRSQIGMVFQKPNPFPAMSIA